MEQFITKIGQLEDTIFQKRMRMLMRQKQRIAQTRAAAAAHKKRKLNASDVLPDRQQAATLQAAGEIRAATSFHRGALNLKPSGLPAPPAPPPGSHIRFNDNGTQQLPALPPEGGHYKVTWTVVF